MQDRKICRKLCKRLKGYKRTIRTTAPLVLATMKDLESSPVDKTLARTTASQSRVRVRVRETVIVENTREIVK